MVLGQQTPLVMATRYTIYALPLDHEDADRFSLDVVYVKPAHDPADEDDSGLWCVVESDHSSIRKYLCRDGKWRYGVSDYDPYFGHVDSQLWTDIRWKQHEELLDQFNHDRYMFVYQATKIAMKHISSHTVNGWTAQQVLAAERKDQQDVEPRGE
jgi:hypothetical protein